MKRALTVVLAAAAAVTLAPEPLEAQAIRTNAGFRSRSIARNDDGSSQLEQIGFTINFFGRQRSTLFVNNNGNVTLDSALATYTPFGLESTRREIIAAFFADVDTRPERSALVTYGQDIVGGRRAFGANYIDVGYFGNHDDKLNSFQLILIDRSDTGAGNFDIEFNYERVVWETGDASGGAGGFGGVPAAVGWSNGSGEPGTSFELAGSLVPGALLDNGPRGLVRNRLNSTVRGRYLFRARNGSISPGLAISTGCPVPAAALGAPYALQLASVGGLPPQRWSLIPDPGVQLPGISLTGDGKLQGAPTALGTYSFTLSLTSNTEDGEQTVTRRCSLTVSPPVVSLTDGSCPPARGTVGARYSAPLRATGAASYEWRLINGALPPGLTLAPAGLVEGVPATAGTYSFGLRVASAVGDGSEPAVRQCAITIDPAPLQTTIAACPLPDGTTGVPYAQTLAAAGGFGPYRWSVAGLLPTGLSLDPEGRISGLPGVAGAYPFTLRVADARGQTASEECWISVNPPALDISSACPLPGGTTGLNYSTRLAVAGGTPPYVWSALGSLPAGLTLNGDGTLSGTPSAAGGFQFRLRVDDSEGRPAAKPCSLVVTRASLSVVSCPLREGAVGQYYSEPLRAIGGSEPYFWQVSGPLPGGLALTTAGRITGTPAESGAFPFETRVIDANGLSASAPCSLRVNPPGLAIATACPLAEGRVGTAYAAQLAASGGAAPFAWSLVGAPPPGLALAADGSLAGVPEAAGVFSLALRVSDAQGQTMVKDCSLAVALPELPAIRLGALPATIPPAAPVTARLELDRSYSLPLRAQIALAVVPETGNSEAELNRADPRVHFSNGQAVTRVTIPAGAREAAVTIDSTGTVASAVTLSVVSLEAAGTTLRVLPPPKTFRVARLAPVITDACFSPGSTGVDLVVSGYSTTRHLKRADVTLAASQRLPVSSLALDLEGPSWDWFLTDDSVRYGGAFTLRVPLALPAGQGASVTGATFTLTNAAGTSASRQAARCQ